MKIINVRGVRIGEGMPKIIAPIVGKTDRDILDDAKAVAASGADIAEWRIDHYQFGTDSDAVIMTAGHVREILCNMPLLITFRTQKEGGAAAIAPEAYARLLTDLCRSGLTDMIDVEAFSDEMPVRQVIGTARDHGVVVVASNHDFHATPPQQEIVRRLKFMAELGADIPKIAVMPAGKQDVLALLSATAEASDHLDRPVITMAMGRVGVVSRLSGECFGSSCTFGSVGQASAPGQVPVSHLKKILSLLHGQ